MPEVFGSTLGSDMHFCVAKMSSTVYDWETYGVNPDLENIFKTTQLN